MSSIYAKLKGKILYADNDCDEGCKDFEAKVTSTSVILGRTGTYPKDKADFLGVASSKSVSRAQLSTFKDTRLRA